MVTRISDADSNLKLGEFLARIRYTGERVILEYQGNPVAAILGIEELKRLEMGLTSTSLSKAERLAALALADQSRERMLAERHGEYLPSSTSLINEQREERERELAGLH